MPSTPANGITLEYQTFGDPEARPLLLLRGLGTQMIQWDPALCACIAEAGHFLVIFDNRDVGLSTHFPGQKAQRGRLDRPVNPGPCRSP